MSVSICRYARAVGTCRTCGKEIAATVDTPEGKEGAHVRGSCGHTTFVRNFEPMRGGSDD